MYIVVPVQQCTSVVLKFQLRQYCSNLLLLDAWHVHTLMVNDYFINGRNSWVSKHYIVITCIFNFVNLSFLLFQPAAAVAKERSDCSVEPAQPTRRICQVCS